VSVSRRGDRATGVRLDAVNQEFACAMVVVRKLRATQGKQSAKEIAPATQSRRRASYRGCPWCLARWPELRSERLPGSVGE
jgi:hypothetical protein